MTIKVARVEVTLLSCGTAVNCPSVILAHTRKKFTRFCNATAQRLRLRCEYRLHLIKDCWSWCVLIDLIKFRAVRDGQSCYLDELGKGLIDENQGDEEGKNLLCERRDVADEETALGRHNHQDNEDEPETDPNPTGQVLVVVGLTELMRKTDMLKKQNVTGIRLHCSNISGRLP